MFVVEVESLPVGVYPAVQQPVAGGGAAGEHEAAVEGHELAAAHGTGHEQTLASTRDPGHRHPHLLATIRQIMLNIGSSP